MITHRIKSSPQILVVFLVALSLLSAGVRVPDLSGPHRPKATQRVVVQNHHASLYKCLKEQNDFVSVVPRLVPVRNTVSYRISDVVSPLYTSPASPCTLGRSPPAPKS
ncbi:hypothetical protein [Geomonas sp.]|uniref:hypothetical protein n=1 Tax=Geomonas sp. TaxID=2651584 RepID=UPI002B475C9B|nr:hypothetical protein [Geomonas sp.]HJV35325.1 hypothetical protein [Geomonas sp.]